MKKIISFLVLFVVVLVLVSGGYLFWQMQTKRAAEQKVPSGTVSTMNTGTVNPLDSAQSANPYAKTNPFASIKINPFE